MIREIQDECSSDGGVLKLDIFGARPVAVVFLGSLIALLSVGCQSGPTNLGQDNSAPTNTSDLSPLAVTVHEFVDQRPDNDRFLASVTFTNSSSPILQTLKFEQLSCLLEDSQSNVIGYKNCGTGGLLPKQSLDLQLDIQTLSDAPAQRFIVLDGDSWETLATFDVNAGTALSQLAIDAEAIYASESYHGQRFVSALAWSQKLEEWEAIRPDFPGPLASISGVIAASRLSKQVNQGREIRNDKWKHCIMGAEIAAITSVKTAIYAAWIKEHEDLTDGIKSTSFDEIDYQATVDGANQAENLTSRPSFGFGDGSSGTGGLGFACSGCAQVCDQRWSDRFKPWDGTLPSL